MCSCRTVKIECYSSLCLDFACNCLVVYFIELLIYKFGKAKPLAHRYVNKWFVSSYFIPSKDNFELLTKNWRLSQAKYNQSIVALKFLRIFRELLNPVFLQYDVIIKWFLCYRSEKKRSNILLMRLTTERDVVSIF